MLLRQRVLESRTKLHAKKGKFAKTDEIASGGKNDRDTDRESEESDIEGKCREEEVGHRIYSGEGTRDDAIEVIDIDGQDDGDGLLSDREGGGEGDKGDQGTGSEANGMDSAKTSTARDAEEGLESNMSKVKSDPNCVTKKISIKRGGQTFEVDMLVVNPIPTTSKRINLDRSKLP